MSRDPAADDRAWSFRELLDHELDAIEESRALRGRGAGGDAPPASNAPDASDMPEDPSDPCRDPIERAHRARLSGFAVSGGGIRSATFNLGVIQGLARLKLLRAFDYLSINSGGGYIGSWLAAWIRREGLHEVEKALREDACRDDGETLDPQAGDIDPFEDAGKPAEGQEVEAGPVRFLRQFSNYLTPRLGLFSADTWTMVSTYLRNLLLNLVVVVLILGSILLLPRLLLLVSGAFDRTDASGLIYTAIGFLGLAIAFIGLNLAQIFPEKSHRWPWFAQQGWIQWLVVVPLFAAAWLAALWLWFTEAGARAEVDGIVEGHRDLLLGRWLGEHPLFGWYRGLGLDQPAFEPVAWALAAALLYLAVWAAGGVLYWLWSRWQDIRHPHHAGAVWRTVIVSAPLAGAVGGFLIYALTATASGLEGMLRTEYGEGPWHLLHVNVWTAPGIIVVFMLTAFVHTGLMGREFPESLREWWSRLGAWMMIYAVTWVGLAGMALYGPIVLALAGEWAFGLLTAGWAGATAAGVVVGRETSQQARPGAASALQTSGRLRRLVTAAAPQIFIVGILALVALGIHVILSPPDATATTAATAEEESRSLAGTVLEAEALNPDCQRFFWSSDDDAPAARVSASQVLQCHSERVWKGTTPGRTLWLLGLLVVGAAVFSWRVDINEFSMHLFYRNRLLRAYMGASNDDRQAQPFTGFDPEDDRILSHYLPSVKFNERLYDGPYPIHNACLNLVGGEELAWQQRKGASFVFTPLGSGFEVHDGHETDKLDAQGFRPTAHYEQTPDGVTVGTAMAISGAAASPNMGAATTPAMAFLLTVFNVRLGWWLGNPRHKKTWWRMGPRVGAAALMSELFGSTDETSPYVYLSDGGHFENLAVYELVRRRCRLIVASDAGADPESTFDDLGNAIRKCCTDFGIEIDIDTRRIFRDPDSTHSEWHCAVGAIRYDKVDPGAAPGLFVYLKASITGDEARDVLTYGIESPTFPHESTADQWFDESQFESYRKLGEHVVMKVFDRADDDVGAISQERLMVRLREAWYPPSGAPQGAFTHHARELDQLFERLRKDERLHFLLAQIYPEWRTLMAHLPERRQAPRSGSALWLPAQGDEMVAGFLFCHSLLQVMETVYLDLGLEDEFEHPDNRGWLNLFRHWTWSGMVRATWGVTAGTFGARFQNFCRRRLGFVPGRVLVDDYDLTAPEAVLDRLRGEGAVNFLEERLVRDFLDKMLRVEEPDRLFVLRVAIDPPMGDDDSDEDDAAKGLRFTFGIALARRDALMYLRIQDHLRHVGLGRKALAVLVREHGLHRLEPPAEEQMPDFCHSQPGEAEMGAFERMYRSVRAGVGE